MGHNGIKKKSVTNQNRMAFSPVPCVYYRGTYIVNNYIGETAEKPELINLPIARPTFGAECMGHPPVSSRRYG